MDQPDAANPDEASTAAVGAAGAEAGQPVLRSSVVAVSSETVAVGIAVPVEPVSDAIEAGTDRCASTGPVETPAAADVREVETFPAARQEEEEEGLTETAPVADARGGTPSSFGAAAAATAVAATAASEGDAEPDGAPRPAPTLDDGVRQMERSVATAAQDNGARAKASCMPMGVFACRIKGRPTRVLWQREE